MRNLGANGRRNSSGRLFNWVVMPCIGIAFVGGAVWTVDSVLSAQGTTDRVGMLSQASAGTQLVSLAQLPLAQASIFHLGRSPASKTERIAPAPQSEQAARPQLAPTAKSGRIATGVAQQAEAAVLADPSVTARFDEVASQARLSPRKLAALFGRAGTKVAKAERPSRRGVSAPAPERFAGPASMGGEIILAYAEPTPMGPAGALAALSAVAPTEDDSLALGNLDQPDDDADSVYQVTPDTTSLPSHRPRADRAVKLDQEPAENPKAVRPELDAAPKPDKPVADKPVAAKPDKPTVAKPDQPKVAYARPDSSNSDHKKGLGQSFREMFDKPRAGAGVAVYDISAATVYMPDGTRLEAHSGIGAMADNPRFVKKKMGGPTPPHTYNLVMREKRFHGVEAIRMLPIDGKNKFGRDGFLTHSYLLRGGRAESHGCVAFKDYQRFLSAFKKGKIKQLVVVASGGRTYAGNPKTAPGSSKSAARVASNGRDI